MDESKHQERTISHYNANREAMAAKLMDLPKEELVNMVLRYRFRSEMARSEGRKYAKKAKNLDKTLRKKTKVDM